MSIVQMLVFLGDSIFEWWNKNIYEHFFSKFQPVNFGKAGYTTKDLLRMLELSNLHNFKPDVIILLIGTNNTDHNYTSQETVNDITIIIELLYELSPNSEIILLGILPRGLLPVDRKRILNEQVNKKLQVAKFSKQIHYADIGYLFTDDDGKISQEIMYDGLHLTPKGYYLLSEALSGFVSAVLPT